MARDFTPEELSVLREHLQEARASASPDPVRQMSHVLFVLERLVDALGESADLTAIARKHFDEVTGKT